MSDHLHDLVIVGAGPVGAAAANLAGALGLDTVAVDRSPEVYPLPRAIHFDAEIMRILQAAGMSEEIEGITRAATGSVHLGMDGEPIREFRVPPHPGDLGWRPHYMFYQPELETRLRRRAALREGVELRLGWRCERVEDGDDGVIADLVSTDGERATVRGRYLLACDGASSVVRGQLGIELLDYGFEEPWIVVDVLVPDEHLGPEHMTMFCDPRRPATYVPGPGRHRRWEFMLLPGEDGDALRAPGVVEALVQEKAPWLDVAQAEFLRSAEYRFHGLIAERWSSGRVFLAGDAVHQTPPFLAQGMCHGIRDVNNLLWKLALVLRGAAHPDLPATYQPEREAHVRAIVEASVANGRYICVLDPVAAARRDVEFRARLRAGADVTSFRAVIPALTGGLLDEAAGGAPDAVGRPLPQPRVAVGGAEVMLDDLLGPGFALVSREPLASSEDLAWFTGALAGRVLDQRDAPGGAADALRGWFDAQACGVVLVRPDRYVFGVADDAAGAGPLIARLRTRISGAARPAGVP